MTTRRQHGKSKKRLKNFHNHSGIDKDFLRAVEKFPVVSSKVDYTTAEPKPLRRKGKSNKGDALT